MPLGPFFRQAPFYAPQTKILEDWTKRCVCVFYVAFNDASPKSSTHPWKVHRAFTRYALFRIPKSSFGEHTFRRIRHTLQPLRRNVRNGDRLKKVTTSDACHSSHFVGQSYTPKRIVWKTEQSVACAFLNEFSMNCPPNRVLTHFKLLQKRTRNALFRLP